MKSRHLMLFVFVCCSVVCTSQTIEHYLQDATQNEEKGQYGAALQSYEKAIGLIPFDSTYVMASVLNSYANVYLKEGYSNEARILYRQAEKELQALEDDRRAKLLRGKLLQNIGISLIADSVEQSIPYLQQAARIFGKYPEEKRTYATLINTIGEAEEHMQHYREAYVYFIQSLKEQTALVGEQSAELLYPLMNVATCLYNMPTDSMQGVTIHDAIPFIEQYMRILRNALGENFSKLNDTERRAYWDMQQRALYNATQIVAYSAYLSKKEQQERATRLLLDIVLLRKSLLLDASLNDKQQGEVSYLNITSEHLQQVLRKNERVVEMVEVGRAKQSEYMAIAISGRGEPKLVPLLGLSAYLYSHADNHAMLNDQKLDCLMWQPLLAESKLPTVIYFVPDGILQTIPVEYVLQDRYRVCERYEVRRLTSSKQLLSRPKTDESVMARPCLIGGCQYNAKALDIEMEAGNGFSMEQVDTVSNAELVSAIQNEYFLPLPGSQKEVEDISNLLLEANYPVKTYLGLRAHKNSLVEAQQFSPTLLHVATHGLFYPSVSESMFQAGLAFSGANTLPNRTQGIMTAEEVSQLHFPDLQLAVMSACHTGQGEVTGEGVWGIQRACKMAGCKAMVLTLWDVEDEITHLMMTTMYRYLAEGMDIYTSFAKATAHIRQQSFLIEGQSVSGNSPDIWCAYVLVDAM